MLLGGGLGLIDAGIVLLLAWLVDRPREFGWYAYAPMPRRYADYLPNSGVHGWSAVAIVIAVLVIANAVIVGAYLLIQKRRGRVA
jgi:heme/copper-type cytochrome/quinol oxidase subunit 1